MTNTEIIATIRNEIERRINEEEATYPIDKGGYWLDEERDAFAIATEYKRFLSFLSTLEKECWDFPTTDEEMAKFLATHPKVEIPEKYKTLDWMFEKSEKPVPKDLEEAADEFANQDCVTFISRKKGFIAGAKWQAEQLLKSSPLPEDTVLFNKGVEEGKRLMMEDYPKWHKVQRGSCFDKHTNFILSAREGHFYCSAMEVPRDGYILLVDELERLPKEDEK